MGTMNAFIVIGCAALSLAGCTASKAAGPQLLSELSSKEDNQLISQVQSRNPGSLCSLATKDGFARLMSYGREAVVDIDGAPTLLSYRADGNKGDAAFTGRAIRISGKLTRENVTDPFHTASRDVSVQVIAGGRIQHLEAQWICQAALISVDAAHKGSPAGR
jgi:hypothetical protein